MALILTKFYNHVANIHLEETKSQIFCLGLSFDLILKNG